MDLQKPGKILYDRQIDYDFLPEDVFLEPETFDMDLSKGLSVGEHSYQILLIPGAQFITEKTEEAIKKLKASGTKVWFLERFPQGLCDKSGGEALDFSGFPLLSLDELAGKLEEIRIPKVQLSPEDNRIRIMHYIKNNTNTYFFVNEGTRNYSGKIFIPMHGRCYQYDAWENQVYEVEQDDTASGTELMIHVVPGKSVCICFDDYEGPFSQKWDTKGLTKTDFNYGWSRSLCESINYPEFQEKKTVSLPDGLKDEKPLFSGFVRYEKCYVHTGSGGGVLLEITKASEGVEVFVNGKSLGIQISAPFQYDLTGVLKKGENNLCIEVATTLERKMSTQPDPIREYMGLGPKEITCGSGLDGKVFLYF